MIALQSLSREEVHDAIRFPLVRFGHRLEAMGLSYQQVVQVGQAVEELLLDALYNVLRELERKNER